MKHLRRAVDHVVIINDGLTVCNRALVRLVRVIDPRWNDQLRRC